MELVILIFLGIAAANGLWALACLTFGAAKAGGPLRLLKSWWQAVTGG